MSLRFSVAFSAAAFAVMQRRRAEAAFDAAGHLTATGAAVMTPLMPLGFGFAAAANDATDDGDQRHDHGENAGNDHTDNRTCTSVGE